MTTFNFLPFYNTLYKGKIYTRKLLIIKLNYIISSIFAFLATWVIFAATTFFGFGQTANPQLYAGKKYSPPTSRPKTKRLEEFGVS